MGAEWVKELAETVAKVVVLDLKLAGRDIVNEAKEVKNWSLDKQKAFFSERLEKMALIGRLDQLILDLEARLQ